MNTQEVESVEELISRLLKENKFLSDKVRGLEDQKYYWIDNDPEKSYNKDDLSGRYFNKCRDLEHKNARIKKLERQIYKLTMDLYHAVTIKNSLERKVEILKKRAPSCE